MNKWERLSTALPFVFGSVLGANILTMSFMNFFETPTKLMTVVYVVFLILTLFLTASCKIKFPTLSRKEHLVCTLFSLFMFLPRAPYLMEHILGYSVIPVGDDFFHITNLGSIIHTPKFPPRSTWDSSKYLAYYYAAWIPGAAIYHSGMCSTVKEALGWLRLIYSFFLVYFPVYASKVLFSTSHLRTAFLLVCVLYGGFDFIYWASALHFVPTHSEWWAVDFGLKLQFSNYVTLSLWVPQHFIAGLSMLSALFVISQNVKAQGAVLAAILFLSGIFSSPFTAFGAIPLAIWYVASSKRWSMLPICATVFTILSLPLWWIFLGNDAVGFQLFGAVDSTMWGTRTQAAFLTFLLVICLELGPLIAAAAYSVRIQRHLTLLFWLSAGYVLSTFFFFFSDNYSMRGSIIPIFTLSYIGTPTIYSWYCSWRSLWPRLAFSLYMLGGVLEYASFTKGAVEALRLSNTQFNRQALISNSNSEKTISPDLVDEAANYPVGWEILEKHKPRRFSPMNVARARQMHGDNAYRVTMAKLLASSGAPAP